MPTALPAVINDAWKRVGELYVLTALEGPADADLLGRAADKWYSTVDLTEDLVCIDLLVLRPNADEEIPGMVRRDWRGTTEYYWTGTSTIDMGRKAFEPVSPLEVEARRPGSRIKVKVGNMANDNLYSSQLAAYKNDTAGTEALVAAITKGLDLAQVIKRV